MTRTFVKVFDDTLDSSVWSYDSDTRIVWITMLIMADKDGLVHASIPGIANRARVSLDKTNSAIEIFQKPDPYSRTPDNDGRRIARVGRDWKILNHGYFRTLGSKINERERKKSWADENIANVAMTCNDVQRRCKGVANTHTYTDTYTNTEADTDINTCANQLANEAKAKAKFALATCDSNDLHEQKQRSKSKTFGYTESFLAFWKAYPKKRNKKLAYRSWINAVDKPKNIVEIVEANKKSYDWTKDNGAYIPHPSTWLNAGGWDDEISNAPPQQPRPMPYNNQPRLTAQEQAIARNQAVLDAAMAAIDAEEHTDGRLEDVAAQRGHDGPHGLTVVVGDLEE